MNITTTTATTTRETTGTPGKLDMSKFASFQTPTKPARTSSAEKPALTVVAEGLDDEAFVTPYSDRMSLTPEDAPLAVEAIPEVSEEEESPSPGVSVELNHRLRFLKHPPPRIYTKI